jgi:hypothetical protein
VSKFGKNFVERIDWWCGVVWCGVVCNRGMHEETLEWLNRVWFFLKERSSVDDMVATE